MTDPNTTDCRPVDGHDWKQACVELRQELELLRRKLAVKVDSEAADTWDETEDEWSARIDVAHPCETGDHTTYATAMAMVGNRHSKGALVELVNWLLKGQP